MWSQNYDHASIGRHALKHPKIHHRVLAVLANNIQLKMTAMCSRKAQIHGQFCDGLQWKH